VRRLSLAQVFAAATVAVAAVVAGSFTLYLRASRESILQASERLRASAAGRVERRVIDELGRAQRALDDVERGVRAGAINFRDPQALEADLFTRMLADPWLEEATFTCATQLDYDDRGEARFAPDGRWQLSVFRASSGQLITRVTRRRDASFAAHLRERPRDGLFLSGEPRPAGDAPDPTEHATFSVLSARSRRGRAIWSDLHYAESDQLLPPDARRVVVSIQKAIDDQDGRFAGVLRVGILTSQLDTIARMKVDEDNPDDPHRVVLLAADDDGKSIHLVARLDPADRVAPIGDDLRVISTKMPPPVAALLASPLVQGLDPERPRGGGTFLAQGQPYLATLHEISLGRGGTTGWFTAVLVPEAHYTRDLVRSERIFLSIFAASLALVVAIGGLTIAAIRRGLGKAVATTARMRAFDFAPGSDASAFRDVDDVMMGLERAKTVVRAMKKYVPVDLVRRLFDANQEPSLGGELADLSLMFTDLEGFTTLSEKLPPDELARRLGDYLEAMTGAIQRNEGTIDKYIGDAIMALWNAPASVDQHPQKACQALLDCMEATRQLYASPAWQGLPPLVTRFGLHRARVMVGNFGAPARLSYTALGDGVNLAARLEPLCKQYGVVALVSEDITSAAEGFVFRRIDRVAVKGKSLGINVYELLGPPGSTPPNLPLARRYEQAFDAYLARDFRAAIDLLSPQQHTDPPSAVLLARCLDFAHSPPPDPWDGVHRATSK